MMLEEIWQACRTLHVAEERELSEEYAELVFQNESMQTCVALLEPFLGVPVKASGISPTPAQLAITKEFGGIYKDQVLFQKINDDSTVLGMLWPWADGVHVTVKLARVSPPEA